LKGSLLYIVRMAIEKIKECLDAWLAADDGTAVPWIKQAISCIRSNIARLNPQSIQYGGCCCYRYVNGQWIPAPDTVCCDESALAWTCNQGQRDAKIIICPSLIKWLNRNPWFTMKERVCHLAAFLIHELAHRCGIDHPDNATVASAALMCCDCSGQHAQ
jgi:hypothetical protein